VHFSSCSFKVDQIDIATIEIRAVEKTKLRGF
jgi:hypothetical protein